MSPKTPKLPERRWSFTTSYLRNRQATTMPDWGQHLRHRIVDAVTADQPVGPTTQQVIRKFSPEDRLYVEAMLGELANRDILVQSFTYSAA